MSTDLKVKGARYNLDVPKAKVARYASYAWSISPNSHHTPPSECYIFMGAIDHKTGFVRNQPEGYVKLPYNIWRRC